jgi:hypothetical protein
MLRRDAAAQAKASPFVGFFLYDSGFLRLAGSEFWGLPGRYPPGIFLGHATGHSGRRGHLGSPAAAGFFRNLEKMVGVFVRSFPPLQKIFEKSQTFFHFSLCNREKMEYNILELL